jgi:periplasmic protein CpxP/Spy
MKKTILSLAVVAALASGAFAMGMGGNCQNGGQDGMGGKGSSMQQGMHGRGGHEMRLLQNLNLTDDQRHKLAILQSEMKLEMTKMRDPKVKSKMQGALTGESFDKKEFIKTSNEMHAKMTELKANHMEKVFNLLTKEQRAELKTLMDKRSSMPMMGKKS